MTSRENYASSAHTLSNKALVAVFWLLWLSSGVLGTVPNTPIWRGPETRRVVAFTFDDGPKSPFTENLLQTLRTLGIKGTFFIVGNNVEKNPDLLVQIASEGHEIANHSYSHSDFTKLSDTVIRKELQQTNTLIETYTGKKTRWFRPPGGNTNSRVRLMLQEFGLVAVMWDVNSEDYTVLNQRFPIRNELKDLKGRYIPNYIEDVVSKVVTKTKPGSIILMHNGGTVTVESLPQIVAALREKGYGFVTLSELGL